MSKDDYYEHYKHEYQYLFTVALHSSSVSTYIYTIQNT